MKQFLTFAFLSSQLLPMAYADSSLKIHEMSESVTSTIEEQQTLIESSPVSLRLASKTIGDGSIWGRLCSITHDTDLERMWAIENFNLSTGENTTLFRNDPENDQRKIQSATCYNDDGAQTLFSVLHKGSGRYEALADVWSFDPNDQPGYANIGGASYTNYGWGFPGKPTEFVDVTSSSDGSVIAWQSRLDDNRQAILLYQNMQTGFEFTSDDPFTDVKFKALASASPFVQPSLSRNGKWLTFVQLRPNFFAVMRYDIENETYKEIRKVKRRKRLHHPSISDDGNIIGWSENRKQTRYVVKNMADDTLTLALNDLDGIEHATLSAEGDMVAYSINGDERRILITDLETMETTQVGDSLTGPKRYLGTTWFGGSVLPIQNDQIAGHLFFTDDYRKAIGYGNSGSGLEITRNILYRTNGEINEWVHSLDRVMFDWTIDAKNRLVSSYGNSYIPYGYNLSDGVLEENRNIYSLDYVREDKFTFFTDMHRYNKQQTITEGQRAKPLSLTDLENKKLSYEYDSVLGTVGDGYFEDPLVISEKCNVQMNFSGNTATFTETCEESEPINKELTVSAYADYRNILMAKSFPEETDFPEIRPVTILIALVDGNLSIGTTSKVAFIRTIGPGIDSPSSEHYNIREVQVTAIE